MKGVKQNSFYKFKYERSVLMKIFFECWANQVAGLTEESAVRCIQQH